MLGATPTKVSAIGLGTGIRSLSSDRYSYDRMADIVRLGIDLGMTFVDTAPGYGDGRSEEVIGQAIQGIREKVFLATKVSPENVTYEGVLNSAHTSLHRLKTDYIDLYQVHWSNPTVPIAETMDAMQQLVREGKIRCIGVSNFSVKEMEEARSALRLGEIVSTQVEYNLFNRGVEQHILPYCESQLITIVAYSPLHHGMVASGSGKLKSLRGVAEKHSRTVAQVALRWLVAHGSVIAIPSTTNADRLKENAASTDFDLSEEDIEEIDRVFAMNVVLVPTDSIRVSSDYGRAVYKTLAEAKENHLNLVPSPVELAEQIKEGEFLKPVHLVHESPSDNEYVLVEGRLRYWAWVIAHDGEKPIPALIGDLENS